MNKVNLLIVNLEDVIRDMETNDQLANVKDLYPVKNIIADILICSRYTDHSEGLYEEMYSRLPDRIEQLDLDAIFSTVYSKVNAIDGKINEVAEMFGLNGDVSEYIFVRWVDRFSMLLENYT